MGIPGRPGGGGKLSHTSYHILDIIPWLIRHGDPEGIDNAVVYSSFWRPTDSLNTLPLGRDEKGKFYRIQQTGQHFGDARSLSEVNAQVHIALRSGTYKKCQVMINFLHEGIGGPHNGRGVTFAKYEHMNLHQGPVAAAEFRRIAGLVKDESTDPKAIGGPDHAELWFYRNTEMALGGIPVERVYVDTDNDGAPAEEFFRVLLTLDDPFAETDNTVSPVRDHQIGVRLLEAAYRSAILETSLGCPHPVVVTFGGKVWSAYKR